MTLKYMKTDRNGKAFAVIIADNPEQAEHDFRENESVFTEVTASPLLDEGVKKLAAIANVNEEQLRHVFEFTKGKPILIRPVDGPAEERIRSVCLLTLVAYETVYGNGEIQSSVIKQHMQDTGIIVGTDFGSKMLNACKSNAKSYAIPIGERKSPKLAYRLTMPGRQEGLRLIKELAGGAASA